MYQKLDELFDLLEMNNLEQQALFSYLDLGGYLCDELIEKAVDYLSSEQPFAVHNNRVKYDLKQASLAAKVTGTFEPDIFYNQLATFEYLTVTDLLFLITFLQQTAFGRISGQERDQLGLKNWMREKPQEFINYATALGLVAPCNPKREHYCGGGFMGTTTSGAKKRFGSFRRAMQEEKVDIDSLWVFTGDRQLSLELDEREVIEAIATRHDLTAVQYHKKNSYTFAFGTDQRGQQQPITEPMMMHHFMTGLVEDNIVPEAPGVNKIRTVESAIEPGHWRATTKQTANDVVTQFFYEVDHRKIELLPTDNYFIIFVQQPYTSRMTRQVQRAFNDALNKRNSPRKLKIHVEGCGPALTYDPLATPDEQFKEFPRLDSEIASLAYEKLTDALIKLKSLGSNNVIRNPEITLYTRRETVFEENKKRELEDRNARSAQALASLSTLSQPQIERPPVATVSEAKFGGSS